MLILIFTIIIYSLLIYFWFRNEDVMMFRLKIIDEDFEESIKRLNDGTYDKYERVYEKLPSYTKMVFSFKPLNKKNWVK
jgi:hypothetical protein